jgi:mannose/fructose/N-acetylgalactosamine-specific phosphotransferase system component IIC
VSWSWILTAGLGGWLAADATALAQLLVSQPLVGGALTGIVWGDAEIGLRVGALLQLFALARPPLGGRTPEDFAAAGIVGPLTAIALDPMSPYVTTPIQTVLGTAAGLATALAGRPLTRWLRARNERLVHWVDAELAAGRASALDRAHLLGVLHAFCLGAGYTLLAAAACTRLAAWLTGFDTPALTRAAAITEPLLWGLGAGIAARTFVPLRGPLPAVFLGFLVLLFAVGRVPAP